MRHSMVLAIAAGFFLEMSGVADAAIDQIVGLSTDSPGSSLVKRFRVSAGAIITGVEVKNNDDGIVFPMVALFRGPASKLSEGTQLAEVSNITADGLHRMRATIPAIVVQRTEDILVAVSWPVSGGVRQVGEGAGIGARALEAPGDCFISSGIDEPLQPLLAELAISLVTQTGKVVGEPIPREGVVHSTYLSKGMVGAGIDHVPIEFGLARSGFASLEIYSVAGRLVRVLMQGEHLAGRHVARWDGNNTSGQAVAAGVYLVKLLSGDEVLTEKILVVR